MGLSAPSSGKARRASCSALRMRSLSTAGAQRPLIGQSPTSLLLSASHALAFNCRGSAPPHRAKPDEPPAQRFACARFQLPGLSAPSSGKARRASCSALRMRSLSTAGAQLPSIEDQKMSCRYFRVSRLQWVSPFIVKRVFSRVQLPQGRPRR